MNYGIQGSLIDPVYQAVRTIPLGSGIRISLTPVLSVTNYASSGQLLGGKLTVAGATRSASGLALLQSVVITDKANQKSAMDLVFWSQNPLATTFTDHLGLTVASADLLNSAGQISIAAADWISFASNAQVTKSALAHEIYSVDGNLYCALVCRGTPTWASASDLQITLNMIYLTS